jgi:glycogen synthase
MSNRFSPLRVLHVTPGYFPHVGGVQTHIHEVGWRLARAGVKVTVLTTDVTGQLPPVEEAEGMQILRVRSWPVNKDYYFAPGIYRIITSGQWDLVHVHGYHSLVAPLAMFAAWRANIPYVLTIHSSGDVSGLRKALRWLQWMLLRPLIARSEKLIAMSQFEVDFFPQRWRIPVDRFVIIPSGAMHLPKVSSPAEGATNETNGNHLIVSIGRLVKYKGHQRVIAALPKVLEQVPDARVRIVGVGPYESTLQQMARKLGVTERVEIGPVPIGDGSDMASLIAKADLVTLLSEHEALGMAVLEALALKRPVLVANTSALREFADKGLARAVPLESTSEEVAMAMVSQLCQPLVPLNVELPTWDDCVAGLLALYRSVARRPQCAF